MFGGEASDKKVKVLSGGEKTRLAMIRLLLEPVNLLILDEPTNHLDMTTKDILKQAIRDFNGTVIVVSHDREFLDGLVDKVYEFAGGKVRECLGGIYEFLEKKKLTSLNELELSKSPAPSSSKKEPSATPQEGKTPDGASSKSSNAKLSYAEQKEQEKIIKRTRKEVEAAEAEITDIESKIADLENQIASGSYSPDLIDQHAALQKKLENAMSVWELASMRLESLS